MQTFLTRENKQSAMIA